MFETRKLPDWSSREEFKEVKPGYFYHHDLEAVREELFKKKHRVPAFPYAQGGNQKTER